MYFKLIVACDSKRGIGLNGGIPWKLSDDMKRFKDLTTFVPEDPYYKFINMVVMGRKTWDSLPDKYRPLPGRLNVILSKSPDEIQIPPESHDLVRVISDFEQIHEIYNINTNNNTNNWKIHDIFVIGGNSLYNLALSSPYCRAIYLTEIYKDCQCDTFFPTFKIDNMKVKDTKDDKDVDNGFQLTQVSDIKTDQTSGLHYRFMTYHHPKRTLNDDDLVEWKNPEEDEYLKTMENILVNGIERIDRTLVGSYFLPGICLKYDISKNFPMSTTKKIVLRWIFEELKLYITGRTDAKILSAQGITIWDGNTSREFLDKRGLSHYPEGDMGETYGFNYRHFGGDYKDCHTEYDHTIGYDQMANVIHLLKTDPTSRRIIINLWNPATQHKAALPSCLFYYQFCVDPSKKQLHCIIHLRSSDYFLANNWNTCTGTLLTHMLCNLEGIYLTPGTITVIVSDAHIYKTHVEQVKENLRRKPYPFPILKVKEKKQKIEDFTFKDFELIGYKSHNSIKAEMAI
jgi:dihydrofolate reductase/thymidylate synthase